MKTMHIITVWEGDTELDVYGSDFTKKEAEKYAREFNKLAEQKGLKVSACASVTYSRPPTVKRLIDLHSPQKPS